MAANARLAVAVHTLGMLAFADECPVTSDRIAESVQTNAVSIRRIFQALGRAGLVVGQMGPNGGARLGRAPEDITLADIWRAVEHDDDEPTPAREALFALPRSGGNPECSVNRAVRPVLEEVFDDATAALERSLASVTLSDVIRRVQARAGAPHRFACETLEHRALASDATAASA
jgi:Rrf2 family protein